jgi:hypothetical protein
MFYSADTAATNVDILGFEWDRYYMDHNQGLSKRGVISPLQPPFVALPSRRPLCPSIKSCSGFYILLEGSSVYLRHCISKPQVLNGPCPGCGAAFKRQPSMRLRPYEHEHKASLFLDMIKGMQVFVFLLLRYNFIIRIVIARQLESILSIHHASKACRAPKARRLWPETAHEVCRLG